MTALIFQLRYVPSAGDKNLVIFFSVKFESGRKIVPFIYISKIDDIVDPTNRIQLENHLWTITFMLGRFQIYWRQYMRMLAETIYLH